MKQQERRGYKQSGDPRNKSGECRSLVAVDCGAFLPRQQFADVVAENRANLRRKLERNKPSWDVNSARARGIGSVGYIPRLAESGGTHGGELRKDGQTVRLVGKL